MISNSLIGLIENFMEEKIRGLLEYPMNEFQNPNWVQAAELSAEIIVLCGAVYFAHDGFVGLAGNIVKKAKEHNCQVAYYYGSGYNAVANNPNINGFTRKEEVDYTHIIQDIEEGVCYYHEFWK